MSFKIPSELEQFGMEQIKDIDEIEENDILIIPSKSDEPRLRVTSSTLSRWGLKFNGRFGSSREKDRYDAVIRAFGDETWPRNDSSDKSMEKAHAFLFRDLFKDENVLYVSGPQEPRIEFADANSIRTKAIVKKPKLPYMTSVLVPFAPLWPMKRSDLRSYPHALAREGDRKAYEMLMKAFGEENLMSSKTYSARSGAKIPNLTAIVDATALLMDGEEAISKCLSPKQLPYSEHLYSCYTTFPMPEGAAKGLFLAPDNFCEKENHANLYAPCDAEMASILSLHANRQFISKILSKGALVFRSAKLVETCSQIQASEVAKEMSSREAIVLEKLENLVNGLKHELPKAWKLQNRLSTVGKELSMDKKLVDAIRKITTD